MVVIVMVVIVIAGGGAAAAKHLGYACMHACIDRSGSDEAAARCGSDLRSGKVTHTGS